MPGCGCAGGTCGCNIIGGDGVQMSGVGTKADPFKITVSVPAVDADRLIFEDSPSVTFTSVGAGTPESPRIVTASVPTAGRRLYPFGFPGTLTVQTGKLRLYNDTGAELTIWKVRASVEDAPVTSPVIVDVNRGGATIFTTTGNRPSIAPGTKTVLSATPDITSWPDGTYLTVDIDAIGAAGGPGGHLLVTVIAN